ncbi:tubulin-binding cofactor A [Gregarina niphandrodes]|uniref:Tubulin-binding cofactor A n=1 Tax=Gregarina niphandrodes TaxID=110365 RepID=A0A023BBT9_GRENI|nr:tubulin-binding cofactor A [Gregarina niphandrodes]EZG80138.1 tubulin-binding cofactor A [Gregarina niphandrodes]|eukprot:XP_011134334.1 tubulin-binding cofactor A [Gregarina niphandrodes]
MPLAPATPLGVLANQLRQKTGALFRCCKEYTTYLQELDRDAKALQEKTAKGETTTQAANVLKETEGMLPIVRKNALKMADGFLDFWEENRPKIERILNETPPEDKERHKFIQECGQASRLLNKLLASEDGKNSALEPAVLAMIRAIQIDVELFSQGKQLKA